MIRWSRSQLFAVLLFVSVAWIWGGSFVAIEVGLHTFPPLWFAGLRYLVAGAVVSAIAVATGRFVPRGRDEWGAIGLVGVLVVAGYHGFLFVGEQSVSGPIAAVVVSLAPVLTGVFAGALLSEEGLSSSDLVGLVLGVAGVVVIADPTGGGVDPMGVVLIFGGVVAYALGSVSLRALSPDLPIAAMQGWSMFVGATLLVIGAVLRGEQLPTGHVPQSALVSFAYLSLVAGVLGYLAYFALLDRVGPLQVNLVAYLEPVTAAMVAWGVLGAAPSEAFVPGFALVFAGFALTTLDVPFHRVGAVVARVGTVLDREVELPAGTRAAKTGFGAGRSGTDWQADD
jgi:drug/metabolite transporter (DMT)-like permease